MYVFFNVNFFLIKTLANPTMSKKEYDWNLGEPPPRIKPHSIVFFSRKKYCCLMVNCFFLVSLIVFSVALTVSMPPRIKPHSIAKQKVYTGYIKEYIHTLNSNPLIPNFNIVIVDAFAGGGE
jgi:hypothetical protein